MQGPRHSKLGLTYLVLNLMELLSFTTAIFYSTEQQLRIAFPAQISEWTRRGSDSMIMTTTSVLTLLALAIGGAGVHAQPPTTLLLTDFGGKADGASNNQAAFKAAFAKCDTLPTGCRLVLPALPAPSATTVYRTSAINLT